MSVDAHELERGALQRKDREQLQTIAAALGRKAPTRARKDQIIDLILELAGQGKPAADKPAAAPTRSAPKAGAVAAGAEQLPFAPPTSARPTGDRAERQDDNDATSAGRNGEPATTVASFSPFDDAAEEAVAKAARRAGGTTDVRAGGGTVAETVDAAPERAVRNGAQTDGGRTSAEAGAAESDRPRAAEGGTNGTREVTRESSGSGAEQGERPARIDRGRDDSGRDDSGRDDSGRDDSGREDSGRDDSGRDDSGRADQGRPDHQGGDGDGQGEREGGSRRRRRRGRDKDRGGPERNDRSTPVTTDRSAEDAPGGGGGGGGEPVAVSGFLDLRDEGYGFLRLKGYLPSKEDVYVPAKFVRQFALRKGDHLAGSSRPAGRGEKNPALLRVDEVNGTDPEGSRLRPRFEELTPLFPDQNLKLAQPTDPLNMTARIIDLISPIGKGQRGLIVSPPKAGKTTIMKTIAKCIEANNPEVKLIVLLVDERPEEVTDMRRSVQGEVVASTFDRPADEHTHVAEMTIERAKRMVEMGEDVVVILDGITRLARAYNLAAPATGRIMSGGIDTGALYPPKRFFGAARNVEEGGSLTILATALVETGSRMDEVIFEEFKGTGNMELRLDRRLAEKRIYPAIDVDASSTRHEELLFERKQLQLVWKLRRVLSGLASDGSGGAGLELLVDRMKTFKSNDEFLAEVAKVPSA